MYLNFKVILEKEIDYQNWKLNKITDLLQKDQKNFKILMIDKKEYYQEIELFLLI